MTRSVSQTDDTMTTQNKPKGSLFQNFKNTTGLSISGVALTLAVALTLVGSESPYSTETIHTHSHRHKKCVFKVQLLQIYKNQMQSLCKIGWQVVKCNPCLVIKISILIFVIILNLINISMVITRHQLDQEGQTISWTFLIKIGNYNSSLTLHSPMKLKMCQGHTHWYE